MGIGTLRSPQGASPTHAFPVLRWFALAWMTVWLPAYARVWGWSNFLHVCDVAVILTCAGLIFDSPLLLSSQAVSSLRGGICLAERNICGIRGIRSECACCRCFTWRCH